MTTAAPSAEGMLPRFDRVERVVHWVTATLVLILGSSMSPDITTPSVSQ